MHSFKAIYLVTISSLLTLSACNSDRVRLAVVSQTNEEWASKFYDQIGTAQLEFSVLSGNQTLVDETLLHWEAPNPRRELGIQSRYTQSRHTGWAIFLVTAPSGERWCSARTRNQIGSNDGNISAVRTDDASILFLITNPYAKPHGSPSQMRVETGMKGRYHSFDVLANFDGQSLFVRFGKDEPGFTLLTEMTKGSGMIVRLINDPVPGLSMDVGVYDNEGIVGMLPKLEECVSSLAM